MDCPKCKHEMETVSFQDMEVDRCNYCKGLWFDHLEHEKLRGIEGAESAIDTGVPQMGKIMDEFEAVCPRCGASMSRIQDSEQPHIVYEQCTKCGGVFMDAGEFTDFAHHTVRDYLKRFFG